jgi:DNA repair protein RadD
VLILSHVQEILKQDFDALNKYMPFGTTGLYSAGLKSREVAQFTVAGIQSVYRMDCFNEHRLVIVDEAHLIPPSGEGRYRTFFANNPDARVVGLTATPYRLGLGMLTDDLFDKIVYEKDILELIDAGYLCPLTSKATEQKMNTRNVKVTAGEFNAKDMSDKFDVESITKHIIQELLVHKETRKHWLIFAIDIDHAEHITAELKKAGVTAACVHSRMDIDRGDVLDLYKAQGFQALVSVECLTTGFDAPNVDLIALLRPTMSPVLHVQMIGRGLRVFPDKENCLVLDFAGNVARLGPINMVKPPKKMREVGGGAAPTRECPTCGEIVHISSAVCTCCGYEFPRAQKLAPRADNTDVIRRDHKYTTDVMSTYYTIHNKAKGGVCMKVVHRISAFKDIYEYVDFEGGQYAAYKARYWWSRRSPVTPPK